MGHVCMGMKKKCTQVLVGKCEGQRRLGRTMHRWDNNIKMFT
jgi:hypothetical protein